MSIIALAVDYTALSLLVSTNKNKPLSLFNYFIMEWLPNTVSQSIFRKFA